MHAVRAHDGTRWDRSSRTRDRFCPRGYVLNPRHSFMKCGKRKLESRNKMVQVPTSESSPVALAAPARLARRGWVPSPRGVSRPQRCQCTGHPRRLLCRPPSTWWPADDHQPIHPLSCQVRLSLLPGLFALPHPNPSSATTRAPFARRHLPRLAPAATLPTTFPLRPPLSPRTLLPDTSLLTAAMKIYTKTGDSGETSLFSGKRVAKNHDRVSA